MLSYYIQIIQSLKINNAFNRVYIVIDFKQNFIRFKTEKKHFSLEIISVVNKYILETTVKLETHVKEYFLIF
jgi:hypothetical protein